MDEPWKYTERNSPDTKGHTMIPFIWNNQIGKSIETKQISGCQLLWRRGVGTDCLIIGAEFPFGAMKNFWN